MKDLLKPIAIAIGLSIAASSAWAQEESTNRVFSETDWSVFVEEDPRQCWIVSTAKESVNTRDGNVVAVNRGDILMFVSFWPESDRRGEVSFTGGYRYLDGSTVTIEIGSDTFELFTSDETAWAKSPEDDRRIVAAMRRGAEAFVTGISARSRTTTRDTISLLGFTKVYEEADKRCG